MRLTATGAIKVLKERRTYPLNQSPLYKLSNHKRLASLLKLELSTLRRLARSDGSAYRVWTEVNEKGKARLIENPYPRLKRAQARVAALLRLITPPDFLTCPVKGRSYVSNARYHRGAREIVTLDVSAYFPSTTWNRVFWFFNKQLLMSSDAAWTLASLATLNGHLPTGSPLSPLLAYYAHQDMWLRIQMLARDAGCKLTVYMDDITVSGDVVPGALVWAIKQEVRRVGLKLSDHKERRFSGGVGVVTGVVVTDSGTRLTKGAHLKLKRLREAIAAESDQAVRKQLERRRRGLEAQFRQVLRA
ncbi:reverse transcriptase family protein [Phenylobacterium terrae]|uniref:Reverse transcriptase family protein n=1 Tax=Phenylobacterium terrae TaxID=2665495 RepID=A0ABW4N086_9CAUL